MKIASLRKLGGALGAVLLLSGLAATPAHAVLVTQWDYLVNSGFSAYSPAGPAPMVEADTPGSLGGLPTRLRWGDPTQSTTDPINPDLQSKIYVEDPIVGPVPALFTNGAFVPGATITHDNFVIYQFQGNALESATLSTQLTLTPLVPPGPTLPTIGPTDFNILFNETKNVENCTVVPGTSCSDIFVLLNPADLVVPLGDIFGDGWFYTVFLNLQDLAPLTPAQCAAAGAAAGCVGLITAEGMTNNFNSSFGVTATMMPSIPEPGTLALLGLVLAVMGLVRRRPVV
jgi:hypothetical protein